MQDRTNHDAERTAKGRPTHGDGSKHRRRLGPFLLLLGAMLVAQPIVLLAAGQQALAACVAVVAILAGSIVYRMIRQKGRVSLAIAVIVVPLLAAVGLSSFRYISPLISRQRTFHQLAQTQIGYQSRSPRSLDRWLTDRSGNLVPKWLVGIIGEDCLTELRSMDGELSELQSVRFQSLDAVNLSNLKLRKSNRDTIIEPALVEWINSHPRIHLRMTIDHYSDFDGEALSRLDRPFSVHVHVDDESGDLGMLRQAAFVEIYGDRLTTAQCGELFTLSELSNLHLTVAFLPRAGLQGISALTHLRHLTLQGTTVDRASLDAIAQLDLMYLSFDNTVLPDVQSDGDPLRKGTLQTLSLTGVGYNQALSLAKYFGCTALITDGPITDQQGANLLELPKLNDVRVFGREYKRYRHESPNLDLAP